MGAEEGGGRKGRGRVWFGGMGFALVFRGSLPRSWMVVGCFGGCISWLRGLWEAVSGIKAVLHEQRIGFLFLSTLGVGWI